MIPKELMNEALQNATPMSFTPDKPWLKALSPGDVVCRMLCGAIPTLLKVSKITEDRIECGPWVFSRALGLEIDEDLGSDGTPNTLVISFIRKPTSDDLSREDKS